MGIKSCRKNDEIGVECIGEWFDLGGYKFAEIIGIFARIHGCIANVLAVLVACIGPKFLMGRGIGDIIKPIGKAAFDQIFGAVAVVNVKINNQGSDIRMTRGNKGVVK